MSRVETMGRLFGVLAGLLVLLAGPAGGQQLQGHGGPVRALAAPADGSVLLSGSFDTSLVLWRPAEGVELRRLLGHDGAVNAVAIDPEGRRALSGGEDGKVIAWDLATGGALWSHALAAKITALALDPDSELAIVGAADGTVLALDPASGAPRTRWSLGPERPTALLAQPERGTVLVAGHLGSLRELVLDPPAVGERLPGSGFAITDLAKVGGATLAVAAIDGTVRLYRLPTLEPEGELVGHEAPILALAAAPAGERLASGDLKGRIVIWSVAERRAERVLEPHRGPVWDLAFTGPALTLWSAGNDAVVRRWVEGQPEPQPGPTPSEPAASEPALAAVDPADRGAKLFGACRACHTVAEDGGNRAGPTLFRLFGRRAGSVPGYPYSEALARSGIVWSEETVDRLFALGPETFTPGSKMPLQRMPDPADRAALIDYLKRVTMPSEGTGG